MSENNNSESNINDDATLLSDDKEEDINLNDDEEDDMNLNDLLDSENKQINLDEISNLMSSFGIEGGINGGMKNMLDQLNKNEDFKNILGSFSSNFKNPMQKKSKSSDDSNNIEESDIKDDIYDDNSTDEDFELDLDKYFISKNGENLCDILSGIKNELSEINTNIKNNINKT